MTSLTETAYYARIAIKYGGIFLVTLMIGRVVVGGAIAYWKKLHPPAPEPPTIGFGVLPEIEFPDLPPAELTYQLETPTGTLPTFSHKTEVYPMPIERPNLLALENSKTEARNLGFDEEPEQLSEVLYRWREVSPYPAVLDMYIYRGNFEMEVNWEIDPGFLLQKNLPPEDVAVQNVKNYLSRARLIAQDMMVGNAKITYLKATGGAYRETVSLSEADFIRVDLFRAPINNEHKVVTLIPAQGVIRAILSGKSSMNSVIEMEYNYFKADYTKAETYPLKTATQAWQELVENKAFIAQLDPGIEQVIVRRMELGYLDTYEPQPYLQPVYIFSGDNNFTAYLPAIDSVLMNTLPTQVPLRRN